MGGEPEINIPSHPDPHNDDISDLDSTSSEAHDADDFLDFPPNFDPRSSSVPPHFLCPLTKSIMLHPAIDSEGNTYERRAILRWLDLEDTSPITGNSLGVADLVENTRRMAAIEAYREKCWERYRDTSVMKKETKEGREKKNADKKKDESIADKSHKLLLMLQDELEALQKQHEEDNQKHRTWLEGLNGKNESVPPEPSHVEYLLHRKKLEDKYTLPNGDLREDTHKNRRHSDSKALQRKSPILNNTTDSNRKSLRSALDPSSLRPPPICDSKSPRPTRPQHLSSSMKLTSERKSTRHDPAIASSMKSMSYKTNGIFPSPPLNDPSEVLTLKSQKSNNTAESKRNQPSALESSSLLPPLGAIERIPRPERKIRPGQDPALVSSIKSTSSGSDRRHSTHHDSFTGPPKSTSITKSKGSPPPPQPQSQPLRRVNSSRASEKGRIIGTSSLSNPSSGIGIYGKVRSSPEPNYSTPTTTLNPSPTTASTSSESLQFEPRQDHGWSVPIGVHKVICKAPGLIVTCDVHRKSAPVRRFHSQDGARSRRKQTLPDQQLVIPPGSYIEVVETQVHGDRVRGRIVWDANVEKIEEDDRPVRKRSSFMLGKLQKKDKVTQNPKSASDSATQYTGWVSLRWTNCGDESNGDERSFISAVRTDEGAGPWTQPVSLGVYRISFGNGLPVRKSPERASTVIGMLDRGQYVEVIETKVKGDRVRARCILAPTSQEGDPLNGWISLFNAVTGSSGAAAVPLGAYVAVSESNCTVTEGGSSTSKFKTLLRRGSCVEVVATRIEDGVVRGLLSTGGFVTLVGPKVLQGKKTPGEEYFLIHVPVGVYKVIHTEGLPVFMGSGADSPSAMELEAETCVQVVETSVQKGRVYGRIVSVINGNYRQALEGWIYLFESNRRWCKYV